MGHDFDGVARAALESAEFLLPQWMGGRRQGHEWVGERTSRGGIGDSWSVNLDSGTWKHFAGTESGADLIALYSELYRVSMNAARIEIIAQMGGHSEAPVLPMRAPRETADRSRPAEPIPEDAPPLRDHPDHGAATAEYRYGNSFVVTRYDFIDEDGEPDKAFFQWTWRAGKWTKQGYGANRPLYELHTLIANPGVPVLVVEGEKCVRAAAPLLPYYAVTTWSGGSQGWRQTDWSVLKDREVMIWPDADDPGREAAAGIAAVVQPLAKRVRVINPNGAAVGWDVGDAIAEGWDSARVVEFMRAHCEAQIEGPRQSHADEPAASDSAPASQNDITPAHEVSGLVSLAQMGLECNGNGVPYPNLANASKVLQMYRNFKDRIWFDEFRGCVYHTLRGDTPQQWTDRDTRQVTVAVQQQLHLHNFKEDLVRHAIIHAAECNARHSLTEWLGTLVWDGIERLDTWLFDCAGVEKNDYTTAVGRNWLIAMIARAYKPGCKMDNIPVLEGISGLAKTQFLEILGGEWYEALPMEFGTKDFLQALQGVWLAEIPDMTGFDRADHSRVISLLSIPRDKYRKSYGYEPERFQRTTIFAATSETDDYLLDRRGKRRFWPLRCTDINLDTLRHQREDLFAEAIVRYRDGESWYKMPASALEEQDGRVREDIWTPKVVGHAERLWELNQAGHSHDVTTEGIVDLLALPPAQQTRREEMRIADILKANGWVRKRDSKHWFWRKRDAR